MYDPWCGIGHSVLMLGMEDIGAHGKVLPQWGLLLSRWGWLVFIDNLPGFRLACIWLGRHFPTDLNEEGRSTLKGSGSIMGAEGSDWIEGRKEKTRRTWTFVVLGSLICSGINKYSYSQPPLWALQTPLQWRTLLSNMSSQNQCPLKLFLTMYLVKAMTEATNTFHYHASLLQAPNEVLSGCLCVIRIFRNSSLLLNLPVYLVLCLCRAHADAVHWTAGSYALCALSAFLWLARQTSPQAMCPHSWGTF